VTAAATALSPRPPIGNNRERPQRRPADQGPEQKSRHTVPEQRQADADADKTETMREGVKSRRFSPSAAPKRPAQAVRTTYPA